MTQGADHDAALKRYLKLLAEQVSHIKGAVIVELASGQPVAHLKQTQPELLDRLVASAQVLRTQRASVSALGLGSTLLDVTISHHDEHHIIHPLSARPELCCALAISRSGANIAMTKLALTQAERALEAP
jgi:predicted regulator of Ras-like GTPase activity (Roadblock/LC7/MglB family)